MSRSRKSLTVILLAIGVGGGFFLFQSIRKERARTAELESALVDSRMREQQLQADRSELLRSRTVDSSPAPSGAPSMPAPAEPPSVVQLRDWLARMPQRAIPELALLDENEWTQIASQHPDIENETDARMALRHLRNAAKSKLEPVFQNALRAYINANAGMLPPDISSLSAYITPPLDPAILQRYAMLKTGTFAGDFKESSDSPLSIDRQIGASMLIGERSDRLVDDEYESAAQFSTNAVRFEDSSRSRKAFEQAEAAWSVAHPGREPSSPGDLVPYLVTPVDPERLSELFAGNDGG